MVVARWKLNNTHWKIYVHEPAKSLALQITTFSNRGELRKKAAFPHLPVPIPIDYITHKTFSDFGLSRFYQSNPFILHHAHQYQAQGSLGLQQQRSPRTGGKVQGARTGQLLESTEEVLWRERERVYRNFAWHSFLRWPKDILILFCSHPLGCAYTKV